MENGAFAPKEQIFSIIFLNSSDISKGIIME